MYHHTMIERNEMRLRIYIAKLEQKLNEEYKVQKEIQQLQLRNKLAELYANDREGYEKALKFSGVYLEPEPEPSTEKQKFQVVQHTPLVSKL
jgi:thioredoxin reductase